MHILRIFLLHWLITAVAVGLCAGLLSSVEIEGGAGSLLLVSLLFGVVNAIIGPILRLLTLPITLVTFGLFALVVNGLLLGLTAAWSDRLDVGGPFETIFAALVIAVFSSVLHFVLSLGRRRPD
ncbi:MAG: phage holin family protein [Aeromicrobium sp.]